MAVNPFSMPVTESSLNSSERVYKAIKDFEKIVMNPPVSEDSVFWGYANDMALPEESNEYVINTIVSHVEHGTPVTRYEWDEDEGRYVARIYKLEEMILQVDSYSDEPEAARMRAECVSAVVRTPLGVDFFKKYGLSSLYADPPRNTTVVVDAEKYVHRWTVNVHLTYTHAMTLNADGFEAATVDVVNVDVRFPPSNEEKQR